MFAFFERLIDPFPRDRTASPPTDFRRFVWFYAKPIWPYLAALAFLSAFIAVVEVTMFSFLGSIVDWFGHVDRTRFVETQGWWLAGMAVVIMIVLPGAIFLNSLVLFQAIFGNVPMRFRWLIHNRLLDQSLAFFQDEFAGRVATKMMQTSIALRETITKAINVLLYVAVYFGGVVVLVASAEWQMALPFLGWLALYAVLLRFFIPRLTRVAERQADARALMTGRIVDAYANIGTVKLFAHTTREAGHARDAMTAFLKPVYGQARLISAFQVSLIALNSALLLSVGALGIGLWLRDFVTVGSVAVAIGVVLRLQGLSQWVMWEISDLFENIGTIRDGAATFAQPIALTDKAGAGELQVPRGEVRFENVGFSYAGAKPHRGAGPVVDGFTLTVRPGEKVGLVGRSGAGKTTLFNLLLRFYDVQSGRILIDGQNIADVTQASLRAKIGMVTQDTSLLHRSVRDNVLYGRPDANEADLRRAIDRAEAGEFIERLVDPEGRGGLDAEVGERGVKLSGGQRQRIAIARIMLKNAPILLLDEATSALDSEVEAAIQENLYRLMEGKTVIAIAHRLSTIASLDRLVVLDRGRIVEEGTHDALLASDGLYAQLWRRQVGGFIDAGEPGEAKAAE